MANQNEDNQGVITVSKGNLLAKTGTLLGKIGGHFQKSGIVVGQITLGRGIIANLMRPVYRVFPALSRAAAKDKNIRIGSEMTMAIFATVLFTMVEDLLPQREKKIFRCCAEVASLAAVDSAADLANLTGLLTKAFGQDMVDRIAEQLRAADEIE